MTALTKPNTIPPVIDGLSEIVDRYDHFFLDVWGVLHDGLKPYPDTIATLKWLQDKGKNVLLLSNSPCLSSEIGAPDGKVGKMGLVPPLYNHFLTSGDASHDHMKVHHDGQKVYVFWPDEDVSAFYGLNLTRVTDVREADFIYASLLRLGSAFIEYEDVLNLALEYKIPLVCGNPDRVVGVGTLMNLCVGTLAEWYENHGGNVIWFGKPYPALYERAWEMVGKPSKSKILAIGDSLVTDVAGATNFGIDVLWNVTGIHWEELKADHAATRIDPTRVQTAMKGHAIPTGLLHGFTM
ncbi:MAG TPA: TIGR01459 family HAD-type hydrolase [Alphaproteobacteria bacterium]